MYQTEWCFDLHVHTNRSDGSTSLQETIDLALDAGITHLSITDHDICTDPAIAEPPNESRIRLIPGIELSAYDFENGNRVHILGYGVDNSHQEVCRLGGLVLSRRQEAGLDMLARLQQLGFEISLEEVKAISGESPVIYKQHLMRVLVEKGYAQSLFGKLNGELFSRSRPGKVYVPVTYIDAIDAVRAIRDSGGLAVLAHPGLYGNWGVIEKLVKNGLEGIEAYHSAHTAKMTQQALALADRLDLIVTAGSDFHGDYNKNPIRLGYTEARLARFAHHPCIKPFMG